PDNPNEGISRYTTSWGLTVAGNAKLFHAAAKGVHTSMRMRQHEACPALLGSFCHTGRDQLGLPSTGGKSHRTG
ncbi:hypothetical protein, partial [Micrococcus luteus]|uniref:hypothetical protein n=1 Tax=Micrococcus luteus TaxID=1270 RepID=UPI001C52CBE6